MYFIYFKKIFKILILIQVLVLSISVSQGDVSSTAYQCQKFYWKTVWLKQILLFSKSTSIYYFMNKCHFSGHYHDHYVFLIIAIWVSPALIAHVHALHKRLSNVLGILPALFCSHSVTLSMKDADDVSNTGAFSAASIIELLWSLKLHLFFAD